MAGVKISTEDDRVRHCIPRFLKDEGKTTFGQVLDSGDCIVGPSLRRDYMIAQVIW